MAAIEVEETIRRIASHKGVEGIIISNFEGVALKSTLSRELTAQYAGLMSQLVTKARSVVRTIDAEDDLVFLRARTKKHEVMVAPGDGYVLVVVRGGRGKQPRAAGPEALSFFAPAPASLFPALNNGALTQVQKF